MRDARLASGSGVGWGLTDERRIRRCGVAFAFSGSMCKDSRAFVIFSVALVAVGESTKGQP